MLDLEKKNITKAADLIKNAKNAVVFTGAGISAESGIPPFRGENGLWSRYDPIVLELSYFKANPEIAWGVIKEIFYSFFEKAEPNFAHKAIAELEKKQIVKAVITQNIDNLHQSAGSENVIEFHGTSRQMICTECGNIIQSEKVDLNNLPPRCNKCSGLLKPDFIFFGEGIPQDAYKKSFEYAEKADLFIISGTTGEVVPASYVPQRAKLNGAKIIEINTEKSRYTEKITDIFLKGKATKIFKELLAEIYNT